MSPIINRSPSEGWPHRYQIALQPVLTEIKKLKSVRKQSNSGTFTREKILEKTKKYLVRGAEAVAHILNALQVKT